jgi:drug/metabolite transporter (DMT)-like permease
MNSALLGSAAALAWGTHDFLARFPSRRIGPVNTLLAVTAAGFLVLSVWIIVSGTPIRIVWPSLWLVAVTGLFSALATFWLFAALAIGPFSIVMPLAGSYPAFAMVFAVLAGERPSAVEWMAVAAVLIGVAAVSQSGRGHEAGSEIQPGKLMSIVGFALLASFGFAASFAGGQAAAPAFGEVQAVWFARIFGLITVGLFYLRPSVRLQIPAAWLPVLGLMGALDVGAFLAVVAAGTLPNPALATVTSSAFGAVTVVLASVILREKIAPIQLIGMVLIFGGVAVLASQ